MGISTFLTYKFYEKRKIGESFFAAIWVLLVSFLINFIANMVFTTSNSLIGYAIVFISVWIVSSGKIKFFAKYKTKNPITTAIVATAVSFVINMILLTLLLSFVGYMVIGLV